MEGEYELVCAGGFAATVLYGVERFTEDIDCLEIRSPEEIGPLLNLADRNSALHRKHGVYLQHVGIVTCPDSYEDRLRPIDAGGLKHLLLFGLDPYDLAPSKLERNQDIDRHDVRHLVRTVPLEAAKLRSRYREEMRPYLARPEREDLTLDLWLEEFFGDAQQASKV